MSYYLMTYATVANKPDRDILMFNNRVIGKGVSLTDNYDRGVQDVEEIGNYFVEETVPTKFSGTLTMTSLELSAGTLEELAIVPDGSKVEDMKYRFRPEGML